jgi:hypothetical protein
MGTHIRYRSTYASAYRARARRAQASTEVTVEVPRRPKYAKHNRTAPR